MKEMMKKVKERREGFTMAELLIVVAIIAVLVAIAIPVFTAQLEKSKQGTDAANCRAAYAEATANLLDSAGNVGVAITDAKMQSTGWDKIGSDTMIGTTSAGSISKTVGQYVKCTVTESSGNVSVKWEVSATNN